MAKETLNSKTVDLKEGLPVENGGHILYVFSDKSSYIENLVSYVADGIKLNHQVLIVDEIEIFQQVREKLLHQYSDEELESVYFEDNGIFYAVHNDFQSEQIITHFYDIMQELPQPIHMTRTWARVTWREQEELVSKLDEFETLADHNVQGQRIVSVCAYDGTQIPTELMIRSLRNHDYFMTDTELVRSPLYRGSKQSRVLPSLFVQSKIESEIDFYKRKLDFVHVVSHEVRNPLTIINAYANILRNTETNLSSGGLEKIIAIEQHVQVIDHELTHIIETEQMLSNELYMKLEPIYPHATIEDVVDLMTMKSNVENVTFKCHSELKEHHSMIGNQMGIRLILSNLISNAIKYTGEQGRVEFSARVQDNQRIRFVVKDNGVGMSSDQLDVLFEKYAKFDENQAGQGIGLYIVKTLTDRFNGTIHIDSELGYGTEVTVDFPLI